MSKKKKKKKRRDGFTRFLLTSVLLAVCAWGAWSYFVPEPEINAVPAMAVQEEETDERPADSEREETGPYVRKPRFWNFLLVGTDKAGWNTDSLMVVAYDVQNQRASIASIPRDTCIHANRKLKKINAAYALGGMEQLEREIAQTFGIPIDFYVKVDVGGFVALVDAVGGIDFEVPCNMNYDDPAQNLSIHFQQGLQHLDGQQTLEVCRFRHNNDNTGYTDTGRMETQRRVLEELAKKLLSNITKLGEFFSIASEHLETDLSTSDLMWFSGKAIGFDMENLNTMMFPAVWHTPYMYLEPDATLEMVNTYLNPFTTDRTSEMLDIAVP